MNAIQTPLAANHLSILQVALPVQAHDTLLSYVLRALSRTKPSDITARYMIIQAIQAYVNLQFSSLQVLVLIQCSIVTMQQSVAVVLH